MRFNNAVKESTIYVADIVNRTACFSISAFGSLATFFINDIRFIQKTIAKIGFIRKLNLIKNNNINFQPPKKFYRLSIFLIIMKRTKSL